jgi:hypothetical protein
MGFYYGSGSQPPDDKKEGSLKEALVISWVVFRTLAMPLGVLFGGVGYLALLFFLFTVHPLAGLGGILVVVFAALARGVWEWRHPPTLQ